MEYFQTSFKSTHYKHLKTPTLTAYRYVCTSQRYLHQPMKTELDATLDYKKIIKVALKLITT